MQNKNLQKQNIELQNRHGTRCRLIKQLFDLRVKR